MACVGAPIRIAAAAAALDLHHHAVITVQVLGDDGSLRANVLALAVPPGDTTVKIFGEEHIRWFNGCVDSSGLLHGTGVPFDQDVIKLGTLAVEVES